MPFFFHPREDPPVFLSSIHKLATVVFNRSIIFLSLHSPRISGMHLKPYLKLQKKERSLDISLDPPRNPLMSQQRGAKEEEPDSTSPSLFPSPPLRKPLQNLSPNTLCIRNGSQSHAEGPGIKERRASQPATIHQGDDGEAPLDIWAVVKPGNTKEKIAFFAAQQCSDNRVSSMKNKSSWDIDGRASKRRKRSLDIKKAKIHLERVREASGRCYQPEPFACSVEHCSVHNVNEVGEGGFPGRPLSVVEMVAFLEQRASVLLAGCTKNCPSASAVIRFSGQPKVTTAPPSAPGSFSAAGADEALSEKAPCRGHGGGGGSDGGPQAEPVRVLEMVAKLESECLKRQSEREGGSLSRNNSFRRNVGRVLLVSGSVPESGADKASTVHQEEGGGKEGGEQSQSKHSFLAEASEWEGPSAGQPSLPASGPEVSKDLQLDRGNSEAPGSWCGPQKITPHLSTYPAVAQAHAHSSCRKNTSLSSTPQELASLPDPNSNIRARESISICISVARSDKGCRRSQPSDSSFIEDTLPGRLFLLLSECELPQERLQGGEVVPPEEHQADAGGKEPHTTASCVSGEFPEFPSEESALQTLGSSALKRQRSHDFLETRFKIQQLLEPQQYLAFLPHHIIVKIFSLLPTRSLVALKCTCGYFKFIIEYYNIRPADSRWVRDPRYREDPCKQCKKKYSRGDVSLCRWHPKPYCQALPYGPGYWMCCHRSQKSVPGCKLGLHDNHWVPACHSFNRALHKKSREPEEDC